MFQIKLPVLTRGLLLEKFFQKMERRNFIKNITAGSITLSGLSLGLNTFNPDFSSSKNELVRDRLWLWG
jgi:hypothetical protein